MTLRHIQLLSENEIEGARFSMVEDTYIQFNTFRHSLPPFSLYVYAFLNSEIKLLIN